MNLNFSKMAEEAIKIAGEMSSRLNHSYIGTEHLLIGLAEVENGVASQVMAKHDITTDRVLTMVEQLISPVRPVGIQEMEGFSPRAKQVIESSAKECKKFGSSSIGTEHILIAIIKENDSVDDNFIRDYGFLTSVYKNAILRLNIEDDDLEMYDYDLFIEFR